MIRTWQITEQHPEQIEFADNSSLDAVTRQLPDGYYSTFRTYAGGTRVLGLRAHLERLYRPLSALDVEATALRRHLAGLLKGYPREARVRVMVTKPGRLYISIEPLRLLPREVYETGVRVQTIAMARITPRLKSTAFISRSQEQRKEIARKGIFEALMVKNGRILEGMTSNFFYVNAAARLGTARRDVLLGVTQRTVIRVARAIGLELEYRPLRQDRLEAAREAFITSSSRGIVPVVQIDDVMIGDGRVGSITRKLRAAYDEYVAAKAEQII